MPDLIVAGAGMAGLAAAAEARRLGADPLVVEKLPRPGGSMRLSSGVIWRHRDFDRFRDECPDGDERLQRLLFERLDDDLDWLESLGAPVVERDTGNPLTTGTRFDPPRALTEALDSEAAGGVRAGRPARRCAGQRAAGPRHRRLRGQPRPAARARLARGGPRVPARGAGQHRATGCGSGSRRAAGRAPGSTRCTRARCPPRRPASASATSSGCPSCTRQHATVTNDARRALRDAHVVRDRRGPVAAHGSRGRARGSRCPNERLGRAGARSDGRRDDRRRGGGGRARPARR